MDEIKFPPLDDRASYSAESVRRMIADAVETERQRWGKPVGYVFSDALEFSSREFTLVHLFSRDTGTLVPLHIAPRPAEQAKAYEFYDTRKTLEDTEAAIACAVCGQAILQSAEVQAWKKDAGRWADFRRAASADDREFLQRVTTYLENAIDNADGTPTEDQIDDAIDAAMGRQP